MYYIKENLKKLNRSKGGSHRNKNDNQIFLDRNEKIIVLEKKIINDLKKNIFKKNLGSYPDFEKFYKNLSNFLKIKEENIFVTDGLDGAIRTIFRCYTKENQSNIIVPDPSYAMYDVYSQMYQVKAKKIHYNNNYELKYSNIFNQINSNTSIVFLPNPNMPIEGFISIDKIIELAEFCKKRRIILFLDEVYYHFNNANTLSLIKKYENLIIARSFSKAFGLASIRLGYIISNKKNIKYISNSRSAYESNALSTEVASYFIDNYNITKNYVNEMKKSFIFLKKELTKLNIEFNGGNNGSYLFINFKNEKKNKFVINFLKDKNIIVRGGWKKPYNNGFSVSAAPIKIYRFFIKILKVALNSY